MSLQITLIQRLTNLKRPFTLISLPTCFKITLGQWIMTLLWHSALFSERMIYQILLRSNINQNKPPLVAHVLLFFKHWTSNDGPTISVLCVIHWLQGVSLTISNYQGKYLQGLVSLETLLIPSYLLSAISFWWPKVTIPRTTSSTYPS